MNWKFWQWGGADADEDEDEAEVAPVPAPSSALERRRARLAQASQKPPPPDPMPDPGEGFYAAIIAFAHVVGPFLIAVLLGVSTGYFLSDFTLAADVRTFVGMGGGMLGALIELAIVMQKRRASKYGQEELAVKLLWTSIGFGVLSVLTQYIFLEVNLTDTAGAAARLESVPLVGLLIGAGGGSGFVLARAAFYHACLYASAWLLGAIKPSVYKQMRWQEEQVLNARILNRMQTIVQPEQSAPALPAGRDTKDLLAILQQMQQQLTELQVKRGVTGEFRAVEESEGSGNGRNSF